MFHFFFLEKEEGREEERKETERERNINLRETLIGHLLHVCDYGGTDP